MTYLANILSHPKKRKLIERFGSNNYEKLYKQAKESGVPFFEWNSWLRQQFDDAVTQETKGKSASNGILDKFKDVKILK